MRNFLHVPFSLSVTAFAVSLLLFTTACSPFQSSNEWASRHQKGATAFDGAPVTDQVPASIPSGSAPPPPYVSPAGPIADAPAEKVLPLHEDSFCVNLGRYSVGLKWGGDDGILSFSGFSYVESLDALILFGGGHAVTPADNVVRYRFDKMRWESDYLPTPYSLMTMENLTAGRFWAAPGSVPPIRPNSRHTYDGWIWSSVLKKMILLPLNNGSNFPEEPLKSATLKGNIGHYDPISKQWEEIGLMGTHNTAHEEDPKTGKILIFNRYGLQQYDPVRRELSRMVDARYGKYFTTGTYESGTFGITESLSYHPPSDLFYYTTVDGKVFSMKLDRETGVPMFTPVTVPSTPDLLVRQFSYDSENDFFVGGLNKGVIHAFKPLGPDRGKWISVPLPGTSNGGSNYSAAYVPRLKTHFFMSRPPELSGRYIYLYALRWGTNPLSIKECKAVR